MRARAASLALAAILPLLLAACASQPSTLGFYDECARTNPTFVAMAQCGSTNRNNWCMANQSCTPDGNATALYADSLVQSVTTRELSEPEAQRRWLEYRAAQLNAARQQDLQRQAIMSMDSPADPCFPYRRCRW